jgi:hypothetical protein
MIPRRLAFRFDLVAHQTKSSTSSHNQMKRFDTIEVRRENIGDILNQKQKCKSEAHSFTAETAEKFIFICSGRPGTNKTVSARRGAMLAEGLGFMENRHLPILDKTILFRVL